MLSKDNHLSLFETIISKRKSSFFGAHFALKLDGHFKLKLIGHFKLEKMVNTREFYIISNLP